MDELHQVSEVEVLLERIADSAERLEVLLYNVQTIAGDLFNLLIFAVPLTLGIIIGAFAMKIFWEGASRW